MSGLERGSTVYGIISQERFHVEVCQPLESLAATCEGVRGSAALLTDQSAAQEAFQIFDTLSADVARFVTILLQVKVFKKKCEKVCFT